MLHVTSMYVYTYIVYCWMNINYPVSVSSRLFLGMGKRSRSWQVVLFWLVQTLSSLIHNFWL